MWLVDRLLRPLDRLRAQHQRRAAQLVLGLLAALLLHNGWALWRNQRLLPAEERFQRSPRDIEKLARVHHRYPVSEWLAVYYLLSYRIGGKSLTIPKLLEDARWEFEKIARVELEVSDGPLRITERQARMLEGMASEERPFRWGTRRRPWLVTLRLVSDPDATHFVLVRHKSEMYIVSRKHLRQVKRRTTP